MSVARMRVMIALMRETEESHHGKVVVRHGYTQGGFLYSYLTCRICLNASRSTFAKTLHSGSDRIWKATAQ